MKSQNNQPGIRYVTPELFDIISLYVFPLDCEEELLTKQLLVKRILETKLPK